ncbi:unnamed protein product [Cladocopium goreaui]|uniref:Laforin n=1 Tax=Cladocopium goreaui TaxID=2562237 RepID=A0A9P1DS26_9DINO|nr:unnamed protein product [Cladocopium goreaui]
MLYHVLSQRFCSQQPQKKILYKSQSLRKNSSNLPFSHLLGGKSPFSFRKKPPNPPIFAATLPRCGGPVRCPRHVSYVGNKPDTFQIYQQNGKVCARRTDYEGDWSVHLQVFCQGRSTSGISGLKKLRIGSSLDNNVKCVEDPGVKCDENAKQLGRTGKYPDTFHIYSHGNQICARRTDSPEGWGIDLVLRCQRTGNPKAWSSMGGKTKVSIGSSLDSHVKCVDAPRAVHCDSTAKQLGRTGKYPDTFHIYHEGDKICARRTDAEAGWGLDLVLECTRSQSGFGGYSYGHRSDYHSYGSDYHYGGYHSGSLYIPSEHSYGSHYHSSHQSYGHHYGGSYGGSYGHFGSRAGLAKVSIGSSLDSHVKCVDAPRAVHCDSTAKQLGRTGKYPDTFHIYHEGDKICARRTDAEAGWSLDLELECQRTGYGGYKGNSHHSYHSSASYKQSKKRVEIGSSDQYIKCVLDPGHVHCDNTASQVGRTGEFPDTFHIYHQGTQILEGTESDVDLPILLTLNALFPMKRICARRTDAQAAWSINLVLDCDLYYKKHYGTSGSTSPGTAFQIGSSPQSALKCVEDPGYLQCDDSAEQVGRTGEFPDTFHIYHENEKICAQRTDANSGWGLNLVLDCRPAHAGYDPGQGDGYYITPKVKFCCAQHLFSEACPYDCEAGDSSVEVTWTSTKREWCCRNRRMGCPANTVASALGGGMGGTTYDCAVADPLSTASQGGEVSVVTAARYDCTHGSKESWSQDKAQYCRLWLDVPKGFHFTECDSDPIGWTKEKARWCQAVGLNEQHAPHKCSRGHPDTWTQQKFEFCCVIKGIGCRQEDPLQMELDPKLRTPPFRDKPNGAMAAIYLCYLCLARHVTGPQGGGRVELQGDPGGRLKDANRNDWEEDASEDALDEAPSYPRPMQGDFAALELHFDCVADEDEILAWSATRQRWCCQKWGLGCKAIGHFNCSAGLWNWQRGWSRQKKNYCCKHEEKGCDGTAHDCTQDTQDLSPDGKKWCCENHMYSNGCPFNCQHGLKLWKIGFSIVGV